MFNIHNIMEEQVESRVNQLYDHVKGQNAPWLDCDCENCRKDTICYVLNRIPPRYILSGRGVTHAST
ncbi:MAG: late competence development ComFB family protein, partial [Treponema sp.]|nr:late competence development ComFB family protein [Treponema sp.]